MGLKGRAAMCGTANTSHWQYQVDVRHITVQPPNALRPVKLSASGAHRQHNNTGTDPGGAFLQALEQHRAGPKAFERPSSPESSRAGQAAPGEPLGLPSSGPQHPHSQVTLVIPVSRELPHSLPCFLVLRLHSTTSHTSLQKAICVFIHSTTHQNTESNHKQSLCLGQA